MVTPPGPARQGSPSLGGTRWTARGITSRIGRNNAGSDSRSRSTGRQMPGHRSLSGLCSGLRYNSATSMTTTTTSVQARKRMGWVIFVAGAVLSWGAYGALLFEGQTQLGSPLKALLCVGVAYFL